jgi:hypothetical protein
MRHRPAAILALLWPAALTTALGAAEQAIVLDRPERVGGLATISASCRSQQHRSVQFDERKPQAEIIDFMVDFAGEREVLAVSAQGQAVRLRLTVARLIRTVAGNPPLVMLPAGTQLVADYAGGHSVFRDGEAKELLAPIQQALRLALDLGDSTPLQDAAFGSAQRRSPGEQWAIRPVPAARLLADLRIIVDPAALSGTAAFAELVPGPEREQQRITATLAFSSFTVPALSADLTVTSSAGTLALDRLYPSDPALALTGEKLLLKESLAAQGKTQLNGHERLMAITMELEQNNEFHLTPHDPVPH